MKRVVVLLALAGLMTSMGVPVASAANTTKITMNDGSYNPTPVYPVCCFGGPLKLVFHNAGTRPHTATQDAPLSLWSTGTVAPGASKTVVIKWAGDFTYHSKFSTDVGMTGDANVYDEVFKIGKTKWKIVLGTAPPPKGFVYDVRHDNNDGNYKVWKYGVTTSSIIYTSQKKGQWNFESRVRRKAGGAASGWCGPTLASS